MRVSTTAPCEYTHVDQLTSESEVSGYLVGSPAFKAGGRGDPTTAGSIPVHLRQQRGCYSITRTVASDPSDRWSPIGSITGYVPTALNVTVTSEEAPGATAPDSPSTVVPSSASTANAR